VIRPRGLGAFALVAALVMGCASTAYTPHAGRRLSVILKEGDAHFVHDGATFDTLDEAVKGNAVPEGFAHERKVHGQEAAWASVVAGVCLVSGVFLVGRPDGTSSAPGWEHSTGIGLVGGALALNALAVIAGTASAAGFWDAMSAYNDDAEAH
jgi:hypothetical protein